MVPGGSIGKASSLEDGMFEYDSWSNWSPDPRRAFDEHDPALEPYASMTREEVFEAMRDARGGLEWEFLLEFALDKCSPEELLYDRFMELLRMYHQPELDGFWYLSEVAGVATRLISPPGHEHGFLIGGYACDPPPPAAPPGPVPSEWPA
jgi:hypothetical protein